jgi:hypothetical protein
MVNAINSLAVAACRSVSFKTPLIPATDLRRREAAKAGTQIHPSPHKMALPRHSEPIGERRGFHLDPGLRREERR